MSLRDVDRAYLTGFRDGSRCASAKAAAADSAETDRSSCVNVQPLVPKANRDRDDNHAVPFRHSSTMTPHEAA